MDDYTYAYLIEALARERPPVDATLPPTVQIGYDRCVHVLADVLETRREGFDRVQFLRAVGSG